MLLGLVALNVAPLLVCVKRMLAKDRNMPFKKKRFEFTLYLLTFIFINL